MRIAFVADQLDCGGAEQQLVTLCKGLKARGHDVHVISVYDRTALRPELDAVGVPVWVAHKYGRFDLSTVWRLRSLLRRIAPDLVHAYLPAASFLSPLTRWLGTRAPVLLSERGVNDWRSPMRLRCDNFVRRSAVHLTCNADAIKRHLIETEGVPAKKVTVIYNGLQAARRTRPDDRSIALARQQIGAPAGAIIVACIANFSPVKQHNVLLRAFATAKAQVPSLFLLLIGRGELEPRIREQVHGLSLEACCRIITECTNPLALVCLSHIAALASQLEGCSNALLEAMAMGLPIVASDAGGNRELIVANHGGYLCPTGDADAFARALGHLALHPELSARMGQYNRRRVLEKFTDDTLVAESLRLYASILRAPSRGVSRWQRRVPRPPTPSI